MPATESEGLRLTVRLRLTLLYGSLFLIAGALLLAVNYALLKRSVPAPSDVPFPTRVLVTREGMVGPAPVPAEPATIEGTPVEDVIRDYRVRVREETLQRQLTQSVLALGVMGVGSVGLGWLMAGRVLRPLHEITATARRLSEENLHERIRMDGPQDELKELADTFDAMLGRLDAAFESQRRFVADASHELRTPLAIIRTEVDVALRDPDATPAQLRAMGETVRTATERTERLLDSLLTLARSNQGAEVREAVDLAAEASVAVAAAGLSSPARLDLQPALVTGDPVLLGRLVGNLVENAVRHGSRDISMSTRTDGGWVVLRVENDGAVIPPEVVPGLFEPFRRYGAAERTGSDRGVGLGLAIVRSVAKAHGGSVSAAARAGGGLVVEVRLPTRA